MKLNDINFSELQASAIYSFCLPAFNMVFMRKSVTISRFHNPRKTKSRSWVLITNGGCPSFASDPHSLSQRDFDGGCRRSLPGSGSETHSARA